LRAFFVLGENRKKASKNAQKHPVFFAELTREKPLILLGFQSKRSFSQGCAWLRVVA
jgi:hypothetical protein